MADELDMLTEREALAAPARIAASRKPVGPLFTGLCLNCDDRLSGTARWCCGECLTDWEKQKRADAQRPQE